MELYERAQRDNKLRRLTREVEVNHAVLRRLCMTQEYHPDRARHFAWVAKEMHRIAQAAVEAADALKRACIEQAVEDGYSSKDAELLYERIVKPETADL